MNYASTKHNHIDASAAINLRQLYAHTVVRVSVQAMPLSVTVAAVAGATRTCDALLLNSVAYVGNKSVAIAFLMILAFVSGVCSPGLVIFKMFFLM